jgi:hypothetical protein
VTIWGYYATKQVTAVAFGSYRVKLSAARERSIVAMRHLGAFLLTGEIPEGIAAKSRLKRIKLMRLKKPTKRKDAIAAAKAHLAVVDRAISALEKLVVMRGGRIPRGPWRIRAD